ncbi:MAG TPA: NAD(P)-dependent oxidoreductase [Gemmatimonadales bacterium]|nr:NAD(P)-dependent oxidoreductase [Gemmatimonadales bacterium]
MPDQNLFHVTSVNHRIANLAERECVTLDEDQAAQLLADASAAGRVLVPLSTCNRTELYSWGAPGGDEQLTASGAPCVRLSGDGALRHLFAVAAGLESQVVGESEILGQVRRAWLHARNAGATNLLVNLIFSHAISAGRRVRRETWLGAHAHSVIQAGVNRVLTGRHAGTRVVVVGAGEAARSALRQLAQAATPNVTIVCRRPAVALPLIEQHPAWSVAPWDELAAECQRADVIIAATAARAPVLLPELLGARACSILDLGLPRNVASGVRALAQVDVLDLDDLRADGCVPRPDHFTAAWRIIDEELDRLAAALRARSRAPRLAELHQAGVRIASEEAERVLRELDGLIAGEAALVRQLAERVAKRVLFPASRVIREV